MALQLFKIETIEVASPVASVTFSSIPQGYTDLMVVTSSRSTRPAQEDPVYVRFNNNSSSVYSEKFLYGNGSAAYSGSTATNYFQYYSQTAASATSNTFGSMSIYIPNYTSSNYKSVSVDALFPNNSATTDYSRIQINAGLFSSTSPITSILIGTWVGPYFDTNSTFTLYGIL